jgi:hypothetical protein
MYRLQTSLNRLVWSASEVRPCGRLEPASCRICDGRTCNYDDRRLVCERRPVVPTAAKPTPAAAVMARVGRWSSAMAWRAARSPQPPCTPVPGGTAALARGRKPAPRSWRNPGRVHSSVRPSRPPPGWPPPDRPTSLPRPAAGRRPTRWARHRPPPRRTRPWRFRCPPAGSTGNRQHPPADDPSSQTSTVCQPAQGPLSSL